MRTFMNIVLIIIIISLVIAWFLGIWGFLGREIQIYNAITGALSLGYVMVRFRGWVWRFMTNREI